MMNQQRTLFAISNWIKDDFAQTSKEEMINVIIHVLGIIFAISALIAVIVKTYGQDNLLKTTGGIVFAASAIITYLASVLYHSCECPQRKQRFRLIDHATIYIMIAGSYTPFTLVTLHGDLGWLLLIAIWSLTVIGIGFKTIFIDTFENLSQLFYLLMGWLSISVIKPLIHQLDFNGFMWLIAGGLLYTIGILFYRKEQYYYSHAIWHVFVLAGTVCHFISIYLYVIS